MQLFARTSGSNWREVSRSIFGFDTSSINDTDSVSSATFSLYGTAVDDGAFDQDLVLDRNVPPSGGGSFAASDFNIANWDEVEQASNRIDLGSFNTSGYNDWTLNATGMANIDNTGETWFGIRGSSDFDNSAPTWVSGDIANAQAYYADETGTAKDPALTVEHSDAPAVGGTIQDLSYVYDVLGNITSITDHSGTGTGKTLAFSYDPLSRLTFATTTAASSTPFIQTFAYNALGNITGWKTNGNATTTYSYATTNYANPHAATTIGSDTLTYDNNGNLTAYGSDTYTWDYQNRMASSTVASTTTTYTYDHTTQRMSKTTGGTTTHYPNQYYQVQGATTTK